MVANPRTMTFAVLLASVLIACDLGTAGQGAPLEVTAASPSAAPPDPAGVGNGLVLDLQSASAICIDPADDIDGVGYRSFPTGARPLGGDPPPHGELLRARLGLDEHRLVVSYDFAGDVLAPDDAAAFGQVAVEVVVYVGGLEAYVISAERDPHGAYAVTARERIEAKTDGDRVETADQDLHVAEKAAGYEGKTLTVSVTREDMPLLEGEFRWTANVSATDPGPGGRSRGRGAVRNLRLAYDVCPNLTEAERTVLAGRGDAPAPRRLLDRLPANP